MAKGNWTMTLFALFLFPACAQVHPVASEAMPTAGDSSQLAPPALPTLNQGTELTPALLPPARPKARIKRASATSDNTTVIASTEWQDHGAFLEDMPMPKMDPVTEEELRQVAPMEAEVGIVSFLRRHMLVLLSGLCLGAVGLYAFYIYPNRRESDTNRFG